MELILTVFKILYRSGICLFMTFLISCTTTQTIWQSAAPVTPEITKNIEEQKQKIIIINKKLQTAMQVFCEQSCSYPLKFKQDMTINAYADGDSINVLYGMLNFATPYELTIVLAHELAHNIMKHTSKQEKNAILGAIIDIGAAIGKIDTQGAFMKIGGKAYSQEFEKEADYIGLYIMARAGYDVDNAAKFWRKMADNNPQNIKTIKSNFYSSHPGSAERYILLEKTSAEIKIKKQKHQPLIPNFLQ